MDVLARIKKLMDERGWNNYRLAKACGINVATVANMFKRETTPTISTLENICKAFGISLSQFFEIGTDEIVAHLTLEQKQFFDRWTTLTAEQKDLLYKLFDNIK